MATSSQTPSTQESPLYIALAAAVNEGRLDDLVCHLIPLLNQAQLTRAGKVLEQQVSRYTAAPGQIKVALKRGKYLYIRRNLDGDRQEKYVGTAPLLPGKLYDSPIGTVRVLGYTVEGDADWLLVCNGYISPAIQLAIMRNGYVSSIEEVAMNDVDDGYHEQESDSPSPQPKGIIIPNSLAKRVQASLSSIECLLKSAGASVSFQGEIGSDLYRIMHADVPVSFIEIRKQKTGLSLNCDIHPSQFIALIQSSAESVQQSQHPQWLIPVAKYFTARLNSIDASTIRGIYELLSS